jgi:hypothetical protein
MQIVVTHDATDVITTGATLNGELMNIGGQPWVDVFFKYGTDPNLGTYTTTLSIPYSNAGKFSTGISSLTPSTTYYFQACAGSLVAPFCGVILSFDTPSEPKPTQGIITHDATDVKCAGATLNGEVTDLGDLPYISGYFLYGPDQDLDAPTYQLTETPPLSSPGVFSADISGLVEGITYYFKACGLVHPSSKPPYVCGTTLSFVSQ